MGHVQAVILATLVAVPGFWATSATAGPRPTCFGRVATIVGTQRGDVLRGTHRADVIVGRGGDDRIFSYDGRDRVCAGDGDDSVATGYGLDLLSAGSGADELDAGPGSDLAEGDAGNDAIEGGPGVSGDSDTLVGGSGSDVLRLSPGTGGNSVFAGRGADQMFGQGRTTFYPGVDNDADWVAGDYESDVDLVSYRFHPGGITVDLAVRPAAGGDDFYEVEQIEGTLFDDALKGDQAPNRFFGLDGSDQITSFGGDDVVDGGEGNDTLDGGEAAGDSDEVSFDHAQQGVTVSLDSDSAQGAGDDTLTGFEDVFGSAYDDVLEGDDESNRIAGGRERGNLDGVDRLFGLAGDDTLDGGSPGSDAGGGFDHCWDSDAANCEGFGHGDPLPASRVVFPQQAQTYGPLAVNRIETQRTSGLGPRVQDVKSSLIRVTDAGCWSWRQRSATFVQRPCGAPIWNDGIRIDEALPIGFYEASSLAIYGEGEARGSLQSTPIEFRVGI